jgi:hypothetical protein
VGPTPITPNASNITALMGTFPPASLAFTLGQTA